jgi:hypothetical protein
MEVCVSVFKGRECVEMVADICTLLGYSVYVPEKETCGPWDMKVNGMRVQVKARDSFAEHRNRVRLKTYMGSGKTAYMSGDVDVFVIRQFGRWYVIPTNAIARTDGAIANGIYMPSVGEWLDRWDVLDGVRVAYSQQKCFEF